MLEHTCVVRLPSYLCQVLTLQHIFTSHVRCVDEFPRIDSDYSGHHLVPGQTFSLYKDGQLVSSGDIDGVFQIESLTKGDYNFTCVVNGRVGNSAMSWPLLVKVTGNCLTIKCFITWVFLTLSAYPSVEKVVAYNTHSKKVEQVYSSCEIS